MKDLIQTFESYLKENNTQTENNNSENVINVLNNDNIKANLIKNHHGLRDEFPNIATSEKMFNKLYNDDLYTIYSIHLNKSSLFKKDAIVVINNNWHLDVNEYMRIEHERVDSNYYGMLNYIQYIQFNDDKGELSFTGRIDDIGFGQEQLKFTCTISSIQEEPIQNSGVYSGSIQPINVDSILVLVSIDGTITYHIPDNFNYIQPEHQSFDISSMLAKELQQFI